MPLFTAQELSDFVREDVPAATAALAERVVWGWLSPILKTDTPPDPVGVTLFGQALELGAIAASNPTALADYQLGQESQTFGEAQETRRRRILAEVVTADGGTANGPQGSFPPPDPWPDSYGW